MVDETCPAGSLEKCWVVILMDPDCSDWSPWSVVAEDKEGAIASARRAWREWLQDEDEDGDGREDSDEA